MADNHLLDASALLAVLRDEPGAERILEVIDGSWIHAVQVAEVIKKLQDVGVPLDRCKSIIDRLSLRVVEEFSLEHAYSTAEFCMDGLSLGDRICLAEAKRTGMIAVTADHPWQNAIEKHPELGVSLLMIR